MNGSEWPPGVDASGEGDGDPPRPDALPGDVGALVERAKELRCLYRVMAVLARDDATLEEVAPEVVEAVPPGWQDPEVTAAELVVEGRRWRSPGFRETPWSLTSPVTLRGQPVGHLRVVHTGARPDLEGGPFLEEEQKLLDTLADQVGRFLAQLRARRGPPPPGTGPRGDAGRGGWRAIVDFLARTDPRLTRWLTLKMLNHLRWQGAEGVEALLPGPDSLDPDTTAGSNRPVTGDLPGVEAVSTRKVFALAARCCSEEEILAELRSWITQDRIRFLVSTVEDPGSSLDDIVGALERYAGLEVREEELPRAVQTMLRVGLLRRFFSEEIAFINSAKGVARVADFLDIARHLLHPRRSHGKLGGKSAGLFVAWHRVKDAPDPEGLLADVRIPRTWYLASDAVLAFVRHNGLEDVYDRKYLDIDDVRQQYPHVIQVFRDASFPPELAAGLARALDDLGRRPLIVRSSSLLEDRTGSAFSGKYKSLFLANQGPREARLRALQRAVAEVYASIFGPDPIEYRAERNLLDVHEEMGIMIQEVVGARRGRYLLPAFSGVALSRNELRWSPRIGRDDGLVRLVPGLGTRAVDRLSDDYPVLFSPGKPGLRVNQTADETVRYAPRKVDLIDLEANAFRTLEVEDLLREVGGDLPLLREIVSVLHEGTVRAPGVLTDFTRERPVVTFEGLASSTPFLARIRRILTLLEEALGRPVDVEFASDGEHLYLLQCRPQGHLAAGARVHIPLPRAGERLLFTAHRYVSNGRIEGITHVVYVDPDRYAALAGPERMREVGRVVGRLNQLLEERRFILMGPGRWGSRGDIRLGVPVGYADISHTALLVEIARRRGEYVPDLSFGTHFFQDLVEAEIRYLPLYPDEPGNVLDTDFLLGARNRLPDLLPRAGELEEVVRVVDVPAETGGKRLRVLMDGESDEAVGLVG